MMLFIGLIVGGTYNYSKNINYSFKNIMIIFLFVLCCFLSINNYFLLVISFFCSNKHSNMITDCFRTSLLKFLFSVVSSEVFFHNTFIIGSHYTQLTDMNYKVTFPLQRSFIITYFFIFV